MPRNARAVEPGLLYHVTQRGTNRGRVFFSVEDRKLYLRLLAQNRATSGVRILAYALMTNHVHLLVVPEHAESLALLFRRVNGRYAQGINIRRGRSGHLWQARFYSCAVEDERLWTAIQYIEENPCRAGLSDRPERYRWSSAATHLTGARDHARILDLDFWRRQGGVEAWRQILGRPAPESDYRSLRACTYAGMPCGSEAFVKRLEERFQRVWPSGPPYRQKSASAA